jgi:hypothetical protein
MRALPDTDEFGREAAAWQTVASAIVLLFAATCAGCAPMSLAQRPLNSLAAERCSKSGAMSEYLACVDQQRLDQRRYDEESSETLRRAR